MNQPTVSLSEDGTLWIQWPRAVASFDDQGFGYGIFDDDIGQYRAGKFTAWAEAVKEIQSAIAAS